MPIYEYRCSSCDFEHEYLQKVSEPRLTECPQCGKPTFDKLVSAAGFQLKGSGWYVTDFRDNGKPGSKEKATEKGTENADKTADKAADKAGDTAKASEPEKKSEGDKSSDSGKPAASATGPSATSS